jgi:acyl carrier protein
MSAISGLPGLEKTTLGPDTDMLDLGIDSLDLHSLMMKIEVAFNFQFSREEAVDLMLAPSIGEWVTVAERALKHAKR